MGGITTERVIMGENGNSDDVIETCRKEINNCIMENQKVQDQMIFVVSAALFGLMPFLLDKLHTIPYSGLLAFLLLLSNEIALISALLSFHFCRKGAEEELELCEQQERCKEPFQNGSVEASANYCNNKAGRSCWTLAGIACNTISWVSMMIVTILVFSVLSLYLLSKEINMASQNNNGSQQNSSVIGISVGNEGLYVPNLPKQTTSQPPKDDSENSKTSKEDNNDKKQ